VPMKPDPASACNGPCNGDASSARHCAWAELSRHAAVASPGSSPKTSSQALIHSAKSANRGGSTSLTSGRF
jgi:hypothetical protein